MRADRLIALLLLLQRRRSLTAAEAAEALEVSERTARRDLEALSMSGVPVYSTAGRGGGWKLVGGARTDLTGLSADEARALFLAAGPLLSETPELKSALRKLSGALPETFRDDAEAAAAAIKIDAAGWGQISRSAPAHLDQLTKCVVAGRQVEIEYESPRSGHSRRLVSPLGLVTKRSVWYLLAAVHPDSPTTIPATNPIRTFRLERISSVVEHQTAVVRPPDFDLEGEWVRIVSVVEAKRGDLVVRILADPAVEGPLRYQFAGRINFEGGSRAGDGIRLAATIAEFGPRALAAQLAGYGDAVEILDPPDDLRAEFERIATELAVTWLALGTAYARSMAAKYQGPPEALEAYDQALVAVMADPHKGAANPYFSLNGNMFTALDADGVVGLRLDAESREEFMATYGTQLWESHGTVMKEYVAVPAQMVVTEADLLASWLQRSYDYAKTLKPKPTTKKKS